MNYHFGKVAVLMGGFSSERDISLQSGKAVLDALERQGVNVIGIDVNKNIGHILQEQQVERVFNMLHGKGGEDGQIQSILNFLNIPYTGSKATASAIAMDKLMTKKLWKSVGLPTPKWKVIESQSDCVSALEELGLPLFVKPVAEGSSVGISKVNHKDEMTAAWKKAMQYGYVIAEEFVNGNEYTTTILGKQTLPVIRMQPANDFYDYEAKYVRDDTQYHCPCGLSGEYEKKIQDMCLKAFLEIGAQGWGRIDFMLNQKDELFLIELNTVPGMTEHSLVPMAAQQVGMDFDQLVVHILAQTLEDNIRNTGANQNA